MKYIFPAVVVMFFAGLPLYAQQENEVKDAEGTSQSSVATSSDTASADSESEVVRQPLCTLEVHTDPPGVTVELNGTPQGHSPVNIVAIDTGRYTLVLKKAGFYQKKAVITVTSSGKTVLNFTLSAPGRLSVSTEPPEAAVAINGKQRGTTPFTDSLLKPGTYIIKRFKTNYQTLTDTMTLGSGGAVTLSDTLRLTEQYRDSLETADELHRIHRKKITTGIIAGAFGVFLLVLAGIELAERP